MIRCRHEVIEHATDKKREDSREVPVLVARRVTFAELVRTEGAAWSTIGCAGELKRVAARVQCELVAGDYPRFVEWASAQLGAGLARAAGLPVAPLRISLAS